MTGSGVDTPQRRLYRYNRAVLSAEQYADLLALEREWIADRAAAHEQQAPRFRSASDLLGELRDLLRQEEQAGPSDNERFLSDQATLEQFKTVVAEFAVDGLVESQSHLGIIKRLPARSRMAVFRVLIDEFGCGNDQQEHSQLYRELVSELDMPTDLNFYVDRAQEPCLGYVNLFYWLAERAPAPEYFLGAYAYFESSVRYAFICYEKASQRLGVTHRQYYTEHLYIDGFHSRQMQVAIRALEAERGADLSKVWAGVMLTSGQVVAATDAAIEKARREPWR